MKIFWKCTHPQDIQNVDEFISLSVQIWRYLALNHLFTNGSSAVNGCRQNEKAILWIENFSQKYWFKVKNVLMDF